jgi:hypothetical protein
MKFFTQMGITRLWIMVLLAGLVTVVFSALSSASTIGDEYGGGVVFYVDGTGQHGLIAAKEDISTTYTDRWKGVSNTALYRWSTGQLKTENVTDYAFQKLNAGTAIGHGAANTTKILDKYPAATFPNSAAAVARAYRGGGYSDWFLPSRDELEQLRRSEGAVGGFTGGYYWSSSELDANTAWGELFGGGIQIDGSKAGNGRVRAVRVF